jgi:hypothetical protein
MVTLAHWVLWRAGVTCTIFGGFVRDFIVGGCHHLKMDLDVEVRLEVRPPIVRALPSSSCNYRTSALKRGIVLVETPNAVY